MFVAKIKPNSNLKMSFVFGIKWRRRVAELLFQALCVRRSVKRGEKTRCRRLMFQILRWENELLIFHLKSFSFFQDGSSFVMFRIHFRGYSLKCYSSFNECFLRLASIGALIWNKQNFFIYCLHGDLIFGPLAPKAD